MALTSPDNVLAYRYNPRNPLGRLADARMVAAVDRGMGLGLYARPGLTAADLRGARVGVDVPVSGFALALYALADVLGVARDDYELVTLGSTPRRLEALLARVQSQRRPSEILHMSRALVMLSQSTSRSRLCEML